MASVVKGGLIYEFTEEPNNYGLVRVLPNENVQLLQDFHFARSQLDLIPSGIYYQETTKEDAESPKCEDTYMNLFTAKTLPPCPAQDLVNKGVRVQPGSYVELTDDILQSPYRVFDVDGSLVYLQLTRIDVVLPFFHRTNKVSGTYSIPLKSLIDFGLEGTGSMKTPIISIDSSEDDTLPEDTFHLWAWSDDDNDQEQEEDNEVSILQKVVQNLGKTWRLLQAMTKKTFGGSTISNERKSNVPEP